MQKHLYNEKALVFLFDLNSMDFIIFNIPGWEHPKSIKSPLGVSIPIHISSLKVSDTTFLYLKYY